MLYGGQTRQEARREAAFEERQEAVTQLAIALLADHTDECPGCGGAFVLRAESDVVEWRRDHAVDCDALRTLAQGDA